jgi:hypothetical protein
MQANPSWYPQWPGGSLRAAICMASKVSRKEGRTSRLNYQQLLTKLMNDKPCIKHFIFHLCNLPSLMFSNYEKYCNKTR